MMKIILEVIAILIILFDVIMVTPLGARWMLKDFDNGSPVRGIIIVCVNTVPLLIILSILSWI